MNRDPLPLPRTLFGIAAAFCAALLAYAYYTQYGLGYEPCPLCILQRIAVFATGLVFLLAAVHAPQATGRRVYGVLGFLFAGAGAVIAARHVWLQNLPPDQVPDCGPGLEYMFDVFPAWDALRMVFAGSGECADIDWALLGLSMPGWVLICVVSLSVFSIWNGFRK
ncbi:MAG: disulfide bond formation protein B [Xanthomonadaceae bacterium]|nr:disulfide bond formation protein B [Xanthomonadaceae bacterium]